MLHKPDLNSKRSKQGYFKPLHPEKFIGNVDEIGITYRSNLERQFMILLDTNASVIKWSYENCAVAVRYYNHVKKRDATYYPDFYFLQITGGKTSYYVVEVKPESEILKPDPRKFKNRESYIRQMMINSIVEVKRQAAVKMCSERGWIFQFVTENYFKKRSRK